VYPFQRHEPGRREPWYFENASESFEARTCPSGRTWLGLWVQRERRRSTRRAPQAWTRRWAPSIWCYWTSPLNGYRLAGFWGDELGKTELGDYSGLMEESHSGSEGYTMFYFLSGRTSYRSPINECATVVHLAGIRPCSSPDRSRLRARPSYRDAARISAARLRFEPVRRTLSLASSGSLSLELVQHLTRALLRLERLRVVMTGQVVAHS
jgi:hypothetical protein